MASINDRGQLVTDTGAVIHYLDTVPADSHVAEVIYDGDQAQPETANEKTGPDGLRHVLVPEELVIGYWKDRGIEFPVPVRRSGKKTKGAHVQVEDTPANDAPDGDSSPDLSAA
jgi:hypothetical protein